MDTLLPDLSPFGSSIGAFVAVAAILFILRIPQASRTVSESYDHLVATLRAEIARERAERIAAEADCKREIAALEATLEALRRMIRGDGA